jgi:hypothetical protein
MFAASMRSGGTPSSTQSMSGRLLSRLTLGKAMSFSRIARDERLWTGGMENPLAEQARMVLVPPMPVKQERLVGGFFAAVSRSHLRARFFVAMFAPTISGPASALRNARGDTAKKYGELHARRGFACA